MFDGATVSSDVKTKEIIYLITQVPGAYPLFSPAHSRQRLSLRVFVVDSIACNAETTLSHWQALGERRIYGPASGSVIAIPRTTRDTLNKSDGLWHSNMPNGMQRCLG